MVEVRWTLQAAQDLASIVEFIAKDSSHYARLFAVDVFQVVDRIALFPESGRVVYRIKNERVELLTIYHAARLLDPSRLK